MCLFYKIHKTILETFNIKHAMSIPRSRKMKFGTDVCNQYFSHNVQNQ